MGKTLIGTATTDENGVATITYTSTGAGDIEFVAESGELVSETYEIEDCIKASFNNWTGTFTTGTDTYDYIQITGTDVSPNITLPSAWEMEYKFKSMVTSNVATGSGLWYIGADNNNGVLIGHEATDRRIRILSRSGGSNTEQAIENYVYSYQTWTDAKIIYYNGTISLTVGGKTISYSLSNTNIMQFYNSYSMLRIAEFKIKPFTPMVDSVSLTSDKSILSHYHSESATLSATVLDSNNDPVENATVSFDIVGGSSLGTATTNSSGVATKTYNATGIGDISIQASVSNVTSTAVNIEDAYYYDGTEHSYTRTSSNNVNVLVDNDTNITLPMNFELTLEWKSTGATTSNEHRLYFMPRSLFVSGSQPSTGIFIGNTICSTRQVGVRRDGTKVTDKSGFSCNTYHKFRIRRNGDDRIYFYYEDSTSHDDYWSLPLANNYTDWCFCFHLWDNETPQTAYYKNVKIKTL